MVKTKIKKIALPEFNTKQKLPNPIDPAITEALWLDKKQFVDKLAYNKDKKFIQGILKII